MHATKKRKRSRGFTLVEVIVTAVIVAVLAAVAIPVYLSYVDSSRQEVVDNLAKTGAASANSLERRTNIVPTDPTKLNLFLPDAGKFTVEISGRTVKVTDNSSKKVGTASF